MGLLDKAQSKSQSTAVKGLLKKAADSRENAVELPEERSSEVDSSKNGVIDFMAITLIERINRLSNSPSRTFTALSLLKTYTSFAGGLCVAPRGEVYESYASVGLENTAVSIPAAIIRKLLLSKDAKQAHPMGTPTSLGLPFKSDEATVWAFPITQDLLHDPLLLIIDNPGAVLETENVLSIIQSCASIFLEPSRKEEHKKPMSTSAELEQFLEKAFTQFQNDDKGIRILIFKTDELETSSISALSESVEQTGLVFMPSKHRIFLACSALRDPLLLGTHVSKITNFKLIDSFTSSSVEEALGSLQSIP